MIEFNTREGCVSYPIDSPIVRSIPVIRGWIDLSQVEENTHPVDVEFTIEELELINQLADIELDDKHCVVRIGPRHSDSRESLNQLSICDLIDLGEELHRLSVEKPLKFVSYNIEHRIHNDVEDYQEFKRLYKGVFVEQPEINRSDARVWTEVNSDDYEAIWSRTDRIVDNEHPFLSTFTCSSYIIRSLYDSRRSTLIRSTAKSVWKIHHVELDLEDIRWIKPETKQVRQWLFSELPLGTKERYQDISDKKLAACKCGNIDVIDMYIEDEEEFDPDALMAAICNDRVKAFKRAAPHACFRPHWLYRETVKRNKVKMARILTRIGYMEPDY